MGENGRRALDQFAINNSQTAQNKSIEQNKTKKENE